jgi:ABC-type nitrate/sulfonate/bicarbonate transport system substrate-binding protein
MRKPCKDLTREVTVGALKAGGMAPARASCLEAGPEGAWAAVEGLDALQKDGIAAFPSQLPAGEAAKKQNPPDFIALTGGALFGILRP